MNRRRALWTLVGVTLLWSTAGVVTRQLESARDFEVTFWRSAATAIALPAMLLAWRGPRWLGGALSRGGASLLASGACWAVMFTAFMLALTRTTIANVLVTTAAGPVLTAVFARYALGHRATARTIGAIAVACVGLGVMYASEVRGGDPRHLHGVLIAALVPLAGAVNLILIQKRSRGRSGEDLLPAVGIGALLSTLVTAPFAWPLSAGAADIGWLAFLGVFQLALPCLLLVRVASVLDAPRVALVSLLEILFGVAWASLFAGEPLTGPVVLGGALVLFATASEPLGALRASRAAG